MRVRFDVGDGRELSDRHGNVIGKIVSLSVDLAPGVYEAMQEAARLGTIGEVGSSGVKEKPSSTPTNQQDGVVGETTTTDPASIVWATYVEAMGPRDKVLHPAERKLIVEALKVATVAECQRAIWGCRRSPFHMGDNAARRKYNRLSHILKGKRGVRTLREQIDFMLDLADKHGVGDMDPTGTDSVTVDPAKLERMKRQVFRAFDMPDSEQAAEQAERAEAWLTEHGWRVIRNGNDRPKIERKDS